MTSRYDFGNGDASGAATGGIRAPASGGAWWNYPPSFPSPKVKHVPGQCWGDVQFTPNGEAWAWPVPCGPFPKGSHLGTGDAGP